MLAIVLSRKNFREHDQRISLYTQEKGKVEALARGVKKITSKNSGSLEPFSVVEVEIIPGKEIDHIGSVQIIELFKNIRADFTKMSAAQHAVSMVEQLFSGAEPDAASFGTFAHWLTALDGATTVNPIILDAMALKLLACLGFAPQLDACVRCGVSSLPLTKGEYRGGLPSSLVGGGEVAIPPSQGGTRGVLANVSLVFDITAGGILCSDCAAKPTPGNQILPMTPVIFESLKTILNQNWPAIFSLTLDKKEVSQLHQLVYQFGVFHSGKKLMDWGALGAVMHTQSR